MKKVLIITYYWPPSGGAGVQRWLKFAKYLPENGWIPVIYTPSNPEYPEEDLSLFNDIHSLTEVIKKPIWEPYRWYKIITGKELTNKVQPGFIIEKDRSSFAEKVSAWIRGNLFIPDARKFWINPSVKFLKRYIRDNPVDAIVSTGPPHSMHMIALGLKKYLDIPWLADFRDPWTQIDFYHYLMLTKWADKKHKYFEKQILNKADAVTTVSRNCSNGLKSIENRDIKIITNGFDEDDFRFENIYDNDNFCITHIGSLNRDRNPLNFWAALNDLFEEIPSLRDKLSIRLIGKTDYSIVKSIKDYKLEGFLEKWDYIPHDQALRHAANASVLLLPLNKTPNVLGITTGKLYEYLALKRPVLCIGPPNGDAAYVLQKCKAGYTASFEDKDGIKDLIKGYFEKFNKNELQIEPENISMFSRKVLTVEMSKILEEISS